MIVRKCRGSRPSPPAAIALALSAVFWAGMPGYCVAEGVTGRVAALWVGRSDGYDVSVVARHGHVVVNVEHGLSTSSYIVENGEIEGDRVKAKLGSFGSIAVRFKPSGPVRHRNPPAGCFGKPSTDRFGQFVGRIKFVGEGRYVVIQRKQVSGIVGDASWNCISRQKREKIKRHKLRRGVVAIAARAAAGRRFVAALRRSDGTGVATVIAATRARHGMVEIQRKAIAIGRPDIYSIGPQAGDATLRPPAPFIGSAIFDADLAAGLKWSGTLHASFPGANRISLVGPEFRVGPVGEQSLARILGLLG